MFESAILKGESIWTSSPGLEAVTKLSGDLRGLPLNGNFSLQRQAQQQVLAGRLSWLFGREVVPAEDDAPLDTAIHDLASYDWLIFTSVNGVKYFFERLLPWVKTCVPCTMCTRP